jgi:hypothetical protein
LKFLSIVDAPRYVSNKPLHNDLHIPSITDEIQRVATKYNKTHNHANDLIEHLYNNGPIDRRLCRTWPEPGIEQRYSCKRNTGLNGPDLKIWKNVVMDYFNAPFLDLT